MYRLRPYDVLSSTQSLMGSFVGDLDVTRGGPKPLPSCPCSAWLADVRTGTPNHCGDSTGNGLIRTHEVAGLTPEGNVVRVVPPPPSASASVS